MVNIQAQQSEAFRFLDLPPEIRNKIYRMNKPRTVTITSDWDSQSEDNGPRATNEVQGTLFNMLLICKQTYQEASMQLYGSTEVYTTPANLVAMLKFQGSQAGKIRRLVILYVPRLESSGYEYREAAKLIGIMHLQKLVVKSADDINSDALMVFLGPVLKATAKARDRQGLRVEPLRWAREMVELQTVTEEARRRCAELLDHCICKYVEKDVEFRKAVIAMRKKHGTPVNGGYGRLWGHGNHQ